MLSRFLLFISLGIATNAFLSPSNPQIRFTLHLSSHASSDSFDMGDLRRRIAAGPYEGLFHEQQCASKEDTTAYYIIKFDQGVHSIEYPRGSGNNVVLAFASEQACTKFAASLRAQQFFDPLPYSILPETLEEFCDAQGVYWQVVPDNVDLIPPKDSVKQIGKHNTDRGFRDQLNYIYAMAAEDMEEDGLMVADSGVFE